jgi:hypothetical protein
VRNYGCRGTGIFFVFTEGTGNGSLNLADGEGVP